MLRDHGVLVVGHGTMLFMLTATCVTKLDHGVLLLYDGESTAASARWTVLGVLTPVQLQTERLFADSLHFKFTRRCVSSELRQAGSL